MRAKLNLIHGDCMDAMREMKDKEFDLAIVDPPYGIGEDGGGNYSRSKIATSKNYKPYHGNDKHPMNSHFFKELKRVSKNQIIWGANHFVENIPESNSSCWVVWDKDNGKNNFADCELAWTSFRTAVRRFKWRWQGMLQEDMANKQIRIHPNEKPVALYKWLLKNYAEPGDKILDTHLGSGSIAIACWDMKFDLTGYEIDKDYYDAMMERLERHKSQLQMF